jgi:octanoyl-[GcvH]:protein N-octanoyltransferase
VIDAGPANLRDVTLFRGALRQAPALEVALAGALLDAVARGHSVPVVRIYRPPATVAFGRQERFAEGFATAAQAARAHGFAPVLRAPGGHAAAYDDGAIVLDEVMPEADAIAGIHERFAEHAERQAQALRTLGVDARVGRVPGEYCPGDFTVNAAGQRKLIGTAQRVVRGAWLFSTVVIVEGTERVRAVLEEVYAALGAEWDPLTAGAIVDEVPGLATTAVEHALLESYADRFRFTSAAPSPEIVAAAERSIGRYEVQ